MNFGEILYSVSLLTAVTHNFSGKKHTRTHARTHARAHACTRVHTCARTRARACTHTHTQIWILCYHEFKRTLIHTQYLKVAIICVTWY